VPVRAVDLKRIIDGEHAENAQGFLQTEIDPIRRAMEPLEKAQAKSRRGGDHRGNPGNFPALGEPATASAPSLASAGAPSRRSPPWWKPPNRSHDSVRWSSKWIKPERWIESTDAYAKP
jgi:hypothetical protein